MHPTWPTRRPGGRPAGVAARGRPRIAGLGDSFVANHHGDGGFQLFDGPINIANALLGQPFAFTRDDNLGAWGETAAEVAERLEGALGLGPDLLVVSAGSNDVLFEPSAERSFAALAGIAEAAAAAGVETLFLAVPPRTEESWPLPEQQARAVAINHRLGGLAQTVAGAGFCDWAAGMVADGPGYLARPGHTHDGIHFSAVGAFGAGVRLADWLRARYGLPAGVPAGFHPALGAAAASLAANPLLGGEDGATDLGAEGRVADGWRLRRVYGDAAALALPAAEGQTVRIATRAAVSEFFYEADPAALVLPAGAAVRGFADVALAPSAAWSHAHLDLVEEAGDNNRQAALFAWTAVRPIPGDAGMRLFMLTDPLRLPAGGRVLMRLRFEVADARGVPAELTIRAIGAWPA